MIKSVAKKSDKNDGIVEVKVEEGQDFLDAQNAALMHYRLTGEAGVYIDPTRDQEPDIAPELGVAPHPELANPAPPAASFSGRALDPASNPMVQSVEEKEEAGADQVEAYNEALQEREEKLANLVDTGFGAPAPVRVVVVEEEEAKEGAPALPADGSQKAALNSGEQLPQNFDEDADKS